MNIGWHFAEDPDGELKGFNDPGILVFPDLPYLLRETIQNSLDASVSPDSPVRVEFRVVSVPIANIPGAAQLRSHLDACIKWDGNRNPPNAIPFFEHAVDAMSQGELPVLIVSDFGTTGLRGSALPAPDSDWSRLVLGTGLGGKRGGHGGTYGVGKYAPFGFSSLRTVMYGTRDLGGHYAFAGVSRLTTHMEEGLRRSAHGWYGYPRRQAITQDHVLPELFHRREAGTDLFILGFEQKRSQWQKHIIKATLENFLVTLYEDRLMVAVEELPISRSTLAQRINDYADATTAAFFHALEQPDAHKKFDGFLGGGAGGNLEVWLARTHERPINRIYQARETGMKISSPKCYSQIPLAGVLVARGTDLNDRLRQLEPPAHNAWALENSSDRDADRDLLNNMRHWVASQVAQLAAQPRESADAVGVAEYLPDDEAELTAGDRRRDSRDPEPVPIVKARPNIVRHPNIPGASAAGRQSQASRSDTHATGAKESPTRKQPGAPNPPPSGRRVEFATVKAWCSNGRDRYHVKMIPKSDITVLLALHAVGESGDDLLCPTRATDSDSGLSVPVFNAHIGPVALRAGTVTSLDVIVDDQVRSAINVTATVVK